MKWGAGFALHAVLAAGCLSPVSDSDDSGMRAEPQPQIEASEKGSGESPPFLLPATDLSSHFVLRQKVSISWIVETGETQDASFDAAIQRQGDSLMLLGLGPMGQVGFVLRLEAGAVNFENRTGRSLPFDPSRMLADVQRVYYPWFDAPDPCRDCVRRTERGGLDVVETRAGGRVAHRRFFSAKDPKAVGRNGEDLRASVEVVYEAAPGDEAMARDVTLRNERDGYQIELETLSLDWID